MNVLEESCEAIAPLKVMIVYDDLPAGRRAIAVFAQISAEERNPKRRLPTLWQFEWLDDPGWRVCATADAKVADLLILAMSATGGIPAAIESWLSEYLRLADRVGGVVLTLHGPQDDWTIFLDEGDAAGRLSSRRRAGGGPGSLPWAAIATGREPTAQSHEVAIRRRKVGSGGGA